MGWHDGPENHAQHHARGVHAGNYADVPVVDWMFGTYINAPDFPQHTGYADGASTRGLDMLLCKLRRTRSHACLCCKALRSDPKRRLYCTGVIFTSRLNKREKKVTSS